MPRYYFNLLQPEPVEDKGGQVYSDDLSAFAAADNLAREIHLTRPSLNGKGCSVAVTDASGKELYRALLDRLSPRLAPD